MIYTVVIHRGRDRQFGEEFSVCGKRQEGQDQAATIDMESLLRVFKVLHHFQCIQSSI